MIRNAIAVLAAAGVFAALPALGQDTGPVRTVPDNPVTRVPDNPVTTVPNNPVRTVPNEPPPGQALPNEPDASATSPMQTVPDKPTTAAEGNRFVFHRVEDSFVRLDLRTGQVSLCSRRTVGWTCQVAPDDRSVLESEITRLRADNAVLKKELLTHGLTLPVGMKAASPPKPDTGNGLKLPTQADFNRVMSFIGKAWQRLIDMIVNLQKDVMKKT